MTTKAEIAELRRQLDGLEARLDHSCHDCPLKAVATEMLESVERWAGADSPLAVKLRSVLEE